jgi:putative addiction module component (TIGR02574 family)
MASVDDAFTYAQSLNPADQQILIERLLAAQRTPDLNPPDAHLAEVERRWTEYKAGRMTAVPWEQVWSEVQAELGFNE